jgi:hypothetical protein
MKQSNSRSENVRAGPRRQACRRGPTLAFPLNCHKAETIPFAPSAPYPFPLAIN